MDGPLMRENRDSSGTTAVDLWQQLVNDDWRHENCDVNSKEKSNGISLIELQCN